MARLRLNGQLGSDDSAPVNLRSVATRIRAGAGNIAIAEAFDTLQRFVDFATEALRQPPSLRSLSVEAADILSLTVGGRKGPGQLQVLSGPPNFDVVGWDGTQSSGTPVTITSCVNDTVTCAAPHGLLDDDVTFIAGTTSVPHIGYWVVDSVTSPTVFKIVGPPTASGTGGTSTQQFAGGWRKLFAIGGTGVSDYRIRTFANGTVRLRSDTTYMELASGAITIGAVNPVNPTKFIVDSDEMFFLNTGGDVCFSVTPNADDGSDLFVGVPGGPSLVVSAISTSGIIQAQDLAYDTNVGYEVGNQMVVSGRKAAVAAPTGGTTIDSQARTAINAIISRLQSHGLIS